MARTKKRARTNRANTAAARTTAATSSTSASTASHPDDEYAIRSVLDCRRTASGSLEYLIDWAPHPRDGRAYTPSWQPQRNLNPGALRSADRWERQMRRERRGDDWIVGDDGDGDDDDLGEVGGDADIGIDEEGEEKKEDDANHNPGDDEEGDQGGQPSFGDDDDGDDDREDPNAAAAAGLPPGNSNNANAGGGNSNASVAAAAAAASRGTAADRGGDGAASASADGSTTATTIGRPAAAASRAQANANTTATANTANAGGGGGGTTAAATTARKSTNSTNNDGGSAARRRPILPPPLTATRRLFTPDALPPPNVAFGGNHDGRGGPGGSSSISRRRLLNSGGEGGSVGRSRSVGAPRESIGIGAGNGTRPVPVGQQGLHAAPEVQIQVGPNERDPAFDWAGLFGRSRFPHAAVPSVSVDADAPTYAADLVRARNEGWPVVVGDVRGWANFCCRWMSRCDDVDDKEGEAEEQRHTHYMDQPGATKAAMTFPLCRYVEEGWSIDLERMRMDLAHSLVPLSIFEPSGGSSSDNSSNAEDVNGSGSTEASYVYREEQRVSFWIALPLIFKDHFCADDEDDASMGVMADLPGCPPGSRYAINDFKFTDCPSASAKLSAQCSASLEGALGFDILSLSLSAELHGHGGNRSGGEMFGENPFQYLSVGGKGTRVETKDAVCGLVQTGGNLDTTFCVLSGSVEFVVTHRSSATILSEMGPTITSEGIEAERCCRPGASNIQSYRTVLGPGDIIFIPTGCLYSIQYLGNSVLYQRLHCTASNVSDFARSLLGGNGPRGCADERCAYFHNMAEGMCIAVNHETEHVQKYVQMGDAGRHIVAGFRQHVDRELKDVALGLISIRYMLWVLVRKIQAKEPVGLFEPYTGETWKKLLDTVDRCLHDFEFRFCVTVPPFRGKGV